MQKGVKLKLVLIAGCYDRYSPLNKQVLSRLI